jgi:hypothetical protein
MMPDARHFVGAKGSHDGGRIADLEANLRTAGSVHASAFTGS